MCYAIYLFIFKHTYKCNSCNMYICTNESSYPPPPQKNEVNYRYSAYIRVYFIFILAGLWSDKSLIVFKSFEQSDISSICPCHKQTSIWSEYQGNWTDYI